MDIRGFCSSYAPTPSIYWKYDVFLSFRGEDTRRNFVSHLYDGLVRAGINVFKDDKELERGKYIRPELLQAIEESRFSIVVFSKNYASSTWCMDELVKITECINSQQQTVIPIFYDVDPSVVRKQLGEFQEVFEKHEEMFKGKKNMVPMWREALKKVAEIAGYDLRNGCESEVVQEIVEKISNILPPLKMNLIGRDSHVEELKRLIVGSDVRMIGICGMGGIGKTAIARAIYNLIYLQFEGSSFLEDVREKSKNHKNIISLQKQLLCETLRRANIKIFDVSGGIIKIRGMLHNKKVLVVIDDVTDDSQLENLAIERDSFGPGSKIIITTRDEKLLHGVDHVYKAELLNDDDALQLFSLNAFEKSQPPENYLELSKNVIQYCHGLPLALKVLGSSLCDNINVDEWESAIKRLSDEPEDKIINRLEISLHGLKETEKNIFLDIACFFKGECRSRVTKILESCGFHSTIGIRTLIRRNLISISYCGELLMHDLLQEMGRQIVKRESPDEPGKRSRLWKKEDVYHVLRNNTGTELIEGIMVEEDLDFDVSAEAFSGMRNLRLLKIKNLQLRNGTLNGLSNNLRLLEWHGYPLKSLPPSLGLEKLDELTLYNSNIELLWTGNKQFSILRSISPTNCHNLREIPDCKRAPNLWELFKEGFRKLQMNLSSLQVHKECVPLKQLTSLKLQDCRKLKEIPDLGCFPNLRGLDISKCPTLCRIDSPFLVHENLEVFEVSDCTRLEALPSKIHMKSLRSFRIHGCPKLKNFSEIAGSLNLLKYLRIFGTAIGDLPLPAGFLPGLESLELLGNSELMTLPSALSGLTSLSNVHHRGYSELENIPVFRTISKCHDTTNFLHLFIK